MLWTSGAAGGLWPSDMVQEYGKTWDQSVALIAVENSYMYYPCPRRCEYTMPPFMVAGPSIKWSVPYLHCGSPQTKQCHGFARTVGLRASDCQYRSYRGGNAGFRKMGCSYLGP